MHNDRKSQVNQIRQWRQEWKTSMRKIDESQKSYTKILSTFAEANPQLASKSSALISEHCSSDIKIQKESQQVFGRLNKVNDSVGQLRETLKYFDKTHESLMKVQKLSQGIFGKMEAIKGQMANSYDQLDDLERKISADIELMSRRIDAFDSQQGATEYSAPTVHKVKNKQNMSLENKRVTNPKTQATQQPKQRIYLIEQKLKIKEQEVEKVEEQVRQLGKFLGWHEEDHKDFLTIWNRNQPNKTYFEIQDELTEYFKMYTQQQIIEHMNKYMKLKKLTDKKKALISQYKEIKEQKKIQQINKIKSSQFQREVNARKEQELLRAEQEQKQMKQKVELWKRQKAELKNEQQRQAYEEQQKKRQQEQMLRREEQEKRKEVLERWKLQQQQKKEKQSKQAPKRPHSAVNKETRDRIREREQQILKQKMQRAIEKKMENEQLMKKAERIKEQKLIKYAYVNSKLQQKTTAVKQKQRTKFDGKEKKDANTFGGQLLLTGIRAVPEWRQGL